MLSVQFLYLRFDDSEKDKRCFLISCSFMRSIQPIATKVPYMVLPGNHEVLFQRRFLAKTIHFFSIPVTTKHA